MENVKFSEDYKPQIEVLISSLPYKIGDTIYQFKDDEIKEYEITKIEISSVVTRLVTINTDLKIHYNVYDKEEEKTFKYTLDGVILTFSSTPLLAVDKVKSKYLDKINHLEQIYNNYIKKTTTN